MIYGPQTCCDKFGTYRVQSRRVFHEGTATAEEGEDHDQGAGADQDVHADVVLVDVQQGDPLIETGLGSDVDREGEQPGADNLK